MGKKRRENKTTRVSRAAVRHTIQNNQLIGQVIIIASWAASCPGTRSSEWVSEILTVNGINGHTLGQVWNTDPLPQPPQGNRTWVEISIILKRTLGIYRHRHLPPLTLHPAGVCAPCVPRTFGSHVLQCLWSCPSSRVPDPSSWLSDIARFCFGTLIVCVNKTVCPKTMYTSCCAVWATSTVHASFLPTTTTTTTTPTTMRSWGWA